MIFPSKRQILPSSQKKFRRLEGGNPNTSLDLALIKYVRGLGQMRMSGHEPPLVSLRLVHGGEAREIRAV